MGLDSAINFVGAAIPTIIILFILIKLLIPLLIAIIKIFICVVKIFLER